MQQVAIDAHWRWPRGPVRRYTSFVIHRYLLAIAMPLLVAGCASAPQPVDQFARSQAAVRAAEEAGADRLDPQSQLYLKLAREQLGKGKQLMDAEEGEKADRLLRRSEADAELARQIAHLQSARNEAEEAKQILSKLKSVN